MRRNLRLESEQMVVLNLHLVEDVQSDHDGSLWYVGNGDDPYGAFEADIFHVVRVCGSVQRESLDLAAQKRLVAEEP